MAIARSGMRSWDGQYSTSSAGLASQVELHPASYGSRFHPGAGKVLARSHRHQQIRRVHHEGCRAGLEDDAGPDVATAKWNLVCDRDRASFDVGRIRTVSGPFDEGVREGDDRRLKGQRPRCGGVRNHHTPTGPDC
jgi:hypothetical protein